MKEQAYNIIKTKDSRTQQQSNLNKSKEARFKISPQEFKDHTLGDIVSLKYSMNMKAQNLCKEILVPKGTSLEDCLVTNGAELEACLITEGVTEISGTELESSSSTTSFGRSEDENRSSDKDSSGNDADTDIGPSYDSDTVTEASHLNNDTFENLFPHGIQSHEQPESIPDTYEVNENNSNIISYVPNMDPDRDKEEHDDVDYEQQRAFFAFLINNLKCDANKCNEVNREAQQVNALLTNELERYKEKEKHFAKDKTIKSEYCKKIKLLNDKISNLKSQACEKDKTVAKKIKSMMTGQTDQTIQMLLPKEDNAQTGKQGRGFQNKNDNVNPSVLSKAKELAPYLYNIDEMGKDELSDHKIISKEELKCEAKKRLKVKQRKSPLSYHGFVYVETQFEEPPKVPLKRRNVNLKKPMEQVQLRNYDPKLWNSLPMNYFCYVKQAMLKFEKQTFSKQELNQDELFKLNFEQSYEHNVNMRVRNRLSGEFEPLVKNVNLQLNCFEKSLVKEMKDDLRYVMSLEDEFDEACLILDIQQEFFKTQIESVKSESYIHPSKKSPGKVPKRINNAEREKLKCEHLNELFFELAGALVEFMHHRISYQPSKKSPGKVPKRTNKAEREKLKREHLNELFLELDGALGSYATNPNGPYHITEFRNMVQTAKLDIASSSSGEIKLSLSCNSDKEKAIFTVTNMDTILKRMDEKCLKSYRVFDPKFSVKKLMEDIYIGSDSSDEPTVGTDATTGFPMSDTLICYILLYMHVFQMPHIMGGFDPCLEDYVTSYYNRFDAQKALQDGRQEKSLLLNKLTMSVDEVDETSVYLSDNTNSNPHCLSKDHNFSDGSSFLFPNSSGAGYPLTDCLREGSDNLIPKQSKYNKSFASSRKRSASMPDVHHNKEKIKCRKIQKILSETNDDEAEFEVAFGQTMKVYASDEDSNWSHESSISPIPKEAPIPNSNGKTKASRGSSTGPQSVYAR
ncbi:hypothetical protein Tco_0140877, partial [Tanacetum coccineum]